MDHLEDKLNMVDYDWQYLGWLRDNIRDLKQMEQDGSIGGELLEVFIEDTMQLIREWTIHIWEESEEWTGVDEIEKIEKYQL